MSCAFLLVVRKAVYPSTQQKNIEAIGKDGAYDGMMSVYTETGSLACIAEYTGGKRL